MKIGSLFSGYEGLGMGVQSVLGGELAWVSDIDPGANKILAHRFPDVPNLGDISTVDWSAVEPVEVLTGGFPCQDVSHAGKRAGVRPGTRSGLWSQMAYAIDQLRPELVVIENVRGLLSAKAHSDVEPCAWCLGDDTDGALRALGAVLGDLAGLGYDASWHGLRAADVGAPHGRFRVFVVAYPASDTGRFGNGNRLSLADADLIRHERGGRARDGWAGPADGGLLPLLGTPRASEWKGSGPIGSKSHEHMIEREYLSAQVLSLLPTPTSQAAKHSGGDTDRGPGSPDDANLWIIAQRGQWGDYAPAIARWEQALGRPAPAPTMTSAKGNPQLSPAFVEWMMGLPAGWVTDVPGLTRNNMLKALGNGVCPQQAEAALRLMLGTQVAA